MSIRKLDSSVVNRIAAGEIIVHPSNALKEIIENSLDAGATNIEVVVKDGGLKLLQITDNGAGIDKSDLGLLCERFATSKLRQFDDLFTMQTYGFRGEALASISHISRFSVVSKTKELALAYKAFYVGGKLATLKFKVSEIDTETTPKPVAWKDGTQISVEDLFYNVPARLRAMRSKNDEWARILDVVGKYAVHSDGVAFSCKKFGETHPSIITRANADIKERIRTVFGTSVASDLLNFSWNSEESGDSVEGLLSCRGALSGLSYLNKRKTAPVFFINNRLVTCEPLRRAVSGTFGVFLPKGIYPFVYLSLSINTNDVDVNVHPTKSEVRFLHEDEIVQFVADKIADVLLANNKSRTFTQSVLKLTGNLDGVSTSIKPYRQENRLVRVDALQQKISSFMKPEEIQGTKRTLGRVQGHEVEIFEPGKWEEPPNSEKLEGAQPGDPAREQVTESSDVTGYEQVSLVQGDDTFIGVEIQAASLPEGSRQPPPPQVKYSTSNKAFSPVALDSVRELKEEITKKVDRPLTNVLSNSVYVGVVDPEKRLCCFQYDVKLFLCDYGAVLNEFFYQQAVSNFGNFGTYILEQPVELKPLLAKLAGPGLRDPDEVVGKVETMSEMLQEYFCIGIENGKIVNLPILVKNVVPPLSKLALFIYRLGTKVNYEDEKACFADVLRQLALLYIPEKITSEEKQKNVEKEAISDLLEFVLFPDIRKSFLALMKLASSIVQVADLPGLYRVFERC